MTMYLDEYKHLLSMIKGMSTPLLEITSEIVDYELERRYKVEDDTDDHEKIQAGRANKERDIEGA